MFCVSACISMALALIGGPTVVSEAAEEVQAADTR
jgi:hypothetical protein